MLSVKLRWLTSAAGVCAVLAQFAACTADGLVEKPAAVPYGVAEPGPWGGDAGVSRVDGVTPGVPKQTASGPPGAITQPMPSDNGGARRGNQPPPQATPDISQPGPWDNDVAVFRIDGESRAEKLATFERAGVATAARFKDGRLIAAFQYFPLDDNRNFDRVAVRFSSDEGRTWSQPEPIVVEGMEAGLARPFDPTLVPLPDGRVRLYFTSNRDRDFRRSTPAIYSAVGADGIHYAFEPGVRFGLENRAVIDCAAVLHAGVYHLIVPDNGTPEELLTRRGAPPPGSNGYHAVSRDGLTFERMADIPLSGGNRWLGNLQSDGGQLVFFGTGPGPWPVISVDGVSWTPAARTFQIPGADPGVVRLRDGSWLLIATVPRQPRPSSG